MPRIDKNKHRFSWEVETNTEDKGTWSYDTGMMKFYKSKEWRTLRAMVLNEEPLCRECKKQGKTKGASVVDHIIPIRTGGDKLDRSNLQSLCHPCHNSKSAKEKHQWKKN